MNPLLAALVAAGILTPDDADRINRSLDPDAARAWAEQQLAVAVQSGLSEQQARLVELVRRYNGNPPAAALNAFWVDEDARLWESMRPTLEDIAAQNAIAAAVRMGADDATWRLVNERMLSWVDAYYVNADAAAVGSIPNLNLTSRTDFARAFAEWSRGELEIGTQAQGLPHLVAALEPTFGPARSEVIAVTETTRVFSESTRAAANANEFVTHLRWYSVADERVCPVCGPLHTRAVAKSAGGFGGGVTFPPAHPNCRCALVEETAETMRQPLPPEERYRWDAGAYEAQQRNQRAARQEPNALRTLTGRG